MLSLKALAQASGRKTPREIEQLRGRLRMWTEGDPDQPLIRAIDTGGRNKRYSRDDLGVIVLADSLTDLGLGHDAVFAVMADRGRFMRWYEYAADCATSPPSYPTYARLAIYRLQNTEPTFWGWKFENSGGAPEAFEDRVAKLYRKHDVLILDMVRLLKPYAKLIELAREVDHG